MTKLKIFETFSKLFLFEGATEANRRQRCVQSCTTKNLQNLNFFFVGDFGVILFISKDEEGQHGEDIEWKWVWWQENWCVWEFGFVVVCRWLEGMKVGKSQVVG